MPQWQVHRRVVEVFRFIPGTRGRTDTIDTTAARFSRKGRTRTFGQQISRKGAGGLRTGVG